MAGRIISCRTHVFGCPEAAFPWFQKVGLRYAECPPPEDGDYRRVAAAAAEHGVQIASFGTHLHVESDEAAEALTPVIKGAASVGTQRIFISVKAGKDTSFEDAVARCRHMAGIAAAHDVVLCMETHPPFGTNGDTARRTIEAVDSPAFRFNFDTANIYYYNEGTDSVTELRKVADLVASVHLKDTDGGYHSPNFPAIGVGVVDFPGVFEVLDGVGFTGPYTMELEGNHLRGLSPEERAAFLQKCLNYLRSIGIAEAGA